MRVEKLVVGDAPLPTTATGMARSRLVESVQETPEPATLDLSSRSGMSHVPGSDEERPRRPQNSNHHLHKVKLPADGHPELVVTFSKKHRPGRTSPIIREIVGQI